MRLWDTEDSQAAMAAPMVHEQDLILRMRRLRRMGTATFIALVRLSRMGAPHESVAECSTRCQQTHQNLATLLTPQNGTLAPLSNGDVVLLWPRFPDPAPFWSQIQAACAKDPLPNDMATTYYLPQDYEALRACIDGYIARAREQSLGSPQQEAEQALQSERARGPLTPWSLNQIEQCLARIDLTAFVHEQGIYEKRAQGHWELLYTERTISLDALRARFFPHTDPTAPKHLFLDLCQILDHHLLTFCLNEEKTAAPRVIGLNISVASVLGSTFAAFTHVTPLAQRDRIVFEIHCGDLLQDFDQTLGVLSTLRENRYRIAVDNVTPDMLRFVRFEAFDFDYIKLDAGAEHLARYADPSLRALIGHLPTETLIFGRCGNVTALAQGEAMGLTKYQGYAITNQADPANFS